ncbi:hypothetical protein [Staphylococcus hominis]|uniref:hypothetical protein n=1 Tax=Staphylococcus hominis TaxID=1290 RepID=UPI002879B61B|nr:hypothetical protein [Staphylococcus hominis]MDS3836316.1 hypothetical protein [Staphylococcus hominis]
MLLSETVKQNYKYPCKGKTPTQVEKELAAMGVEGFVIRMTNVHVTMRVPKDSKKRNRECVRNGRS